MTLPYFQLLATASLVVLSCTEISVNVVELGSNTLSEGLVAHYRFDEALGTSVHDSSGNRRDGILIGGQWLGDGQFGGALRLGPNEFVRVDSFPDAPSQFTVSAWVRITSYSQDTTDLGQWGTVVSTELGSTGGWELNVSHLNPSPALDFGLWRGPYQGDYDSASCSCLPLSRWTHVVAVVDSANLNLSLFVDGALRRSTKVERGILPGSAELDIGQWPAGGRFLMGDVDEIAIWHRALVEEEIANLSAQAVVDP